MSAGGGQYGVVGSPVSLAQLAGTTYAARMVLFKWNLSAQKASCIVPRTVDVRVQDRVRLAPGEPG